MFFKKENVFKQVQVTTHLSRPRPKPQSAAISQNLLREALGTIGHTNRTMGVATFCKGGDPFGKLQYIKNLVCASATNFIFSVKLGRCYLSIGTGCNRPTTYAVCIASKINKINALFF